MTIAVAGVAIVAIAANLIPARHAAGVDPLTSLRWEQLAEQQVSRANRDDL